MKPIDDIVSGALDETVSVASLLRKCLVVSDKLKNNKLRSWVLGELNGYPDHQHLPEYRLLNINSVGYFIGGFGSSIRDQPLAAAVLEKEHHEWATTAFLMEPISAYERLLSDSKDTSTLAIAWPADLVVRYQDKFIEGMALNRAKQVIPVSGLSGIVDKVRNKLLEFALELRNEVGAAEPTPDNPPPEVVERNVTNIIYGGQTNVYGGGSIGGDIVQGTGHSIVKGNFASLSQALADLGIPEKLHAELSDALDQDRKDGHVSEIGPRAKGWLRSALSSLGRGATKVASAVTEKLATAAILAYLGIHSAQ